MGLNDIRLTGASLAELYPRSLVDTGDTGPAGPATSLAVEEAAPTRGLQPSARHEDVPAATGNTGTEPAARHQGHPAGNGNNGTEPPANNAGTSTQAATEAVAGAAATPTPWKFLGNNKKRVLVVVDYAGTSYLPDEELGFLTKMLTACNLGLDDVAIVNSALHPGMNPAAYQRQFTSLQVLLFGKDPESFGLPMSFPPFQVQSFAGTAYLAAPVLGSMMHDKEQKTILWNSLKRLFNL